MHTPNQQHHLHLPDNPITQAELETRYSKNNRRRIFKEALERELDDNLELYAISFYLRIPAVIDIYCNNDAIHESKRNRWLALRDAVNKHGLEGLLLDLLSCVFSQNRVLTMQEVTGKLSNSKYLADKSANPFDAVITAAELVALSQSKLMHSIMQRGSGRYTEVMINPIMHAVYMHTFRSTFAWINETGFNLPLIEPPLPVENNFHNGYHTIKLPVLTGKKIKPNELPLNLDVINRLNSIPWVINQDVLAEPELPSKKLKNQQAQNNFILQVTQSNDIYQLLQKCTSDTNRIYFVWQYSSNSRLFMHGYHLNLQSYSYKRAMLDFAIDEHIEGGDQYGY